MTQVLKEKCYVRGRETLVSSTHLDYVTGVV